MDIETQHLTTTHVALTVGALVITYGLIAAFILPLLSETEKFLKTTPWVGVKSGVFSRFNGGRKFLFGARELVSEGYAKYSSKKSIFILPQFFTDPLVVLPVDTINDFVNLPDSHVDFTAANEEAIAVPYTIGHDMNDGPHIGVVRRQLTRRLPLLAPYVYEELVLAMKDQWPVNAHEWTTVKIIPTTMRIVSRAANRVFSGAQLCRNQDFIDGSREYTVAVFTAGGLFQLTPKFLQPIMAPFYLRSMRKNFNKCKAVAVPIIRQRLKDIQNNPTDPNYKAPLDALQWTLEDCVKLAKDDPKMLDEHTLVRRLLLVNMVAIHTTSMTTSSTILDLFSSPRKEEYLEGLREEVERVLRENGGEWSKSAINDMHRIDSTIRETMRFSGLGEVGLRRKVVGKDGVTLSNGTHLPYGVTVVAPQQAIHTDSAIYGETAHEWDAFRFSRPREAYLAKIKESGGGAGADHLKTVLDQKNQSLVSTGDDFVAFGHGRHACPGRFFATQELKLALAHIVMNYDIKVLDLGANGRPKLQSINGTSIVDPSTRIQLKLRSSQ